MANGGTNTNVGFSLTSPDSSITVAGGGYPIFTLINASSQPNITTLANCTTVGTITTGTWTGTNIAVAHGGTGTSTPALVPGTGIAITGTWPNQTVATTGIVNSIVPGTNIAVSGATGNVTVSTVAAPTFTGLITASAGITGTLTGHASLDLPLTGGTLSGALTMSSGFTANSFSSVHGASGQGDVFDVVSTGAANSTVQTTLVSAATNRMIVSWDTVSGCRIFDANNNSTWLTQGGTTAGSVKTANNTLDNGSGGMILTYSGATNPLTINVPAASNLNAIKITQPTSVTSNNMAIQFQPNGGSTSSWSFGTDFVHAANNDFWFSQANVGGVLRLSYDVTANAFTNGAVSTLHNTLDNGSGNATINGVLTAINAGTTPLVLTATSTTNAHEVALFMNNSGIASSGIGLTWDSVNGIRVIDTINGTNWLTQGGTTSGSVKTLNNTLDDGGGNVTIKAGAGLVVDNIGGTSADLRINPHASGQSIFLGHDMASTNVIIGAGSTASAFVVENTTATLLSVQNSGSVTTKNNILDNGSGLCQSAGFNSTQYVTAQSTQGFFWSSNTAGTFANTNFFNVTSSTSGGLNFIDSHSTTTPLTIAPTTGVLTVTGTARNAAVVNSSFSGAVQIELESSGSPVGFWGYNTTNGVTLYNGNGTPVLFQSTSSAATSATSLRTVNNILDNGSGAMLILGGISGATLSLGTPLSVGNGGSGTPSPSLSAGNGISIANAWPNQTISVANYATNSQTVGFTGPWSGTVNCTVTSVRYVNVVFIRVSSIVAAFTTNTFATGNTALTSTFWPSTDRTFPIQVENNSNFVGGWIRIDTAGNMIVQCSTSFMQPATFNTGPNVGWGFDICVNWII